MYHFFLSYARGDDDEYVRRFYADLCREIRVHGGLRRDEHVGFMDTTDIPLGAPWPLELASAIVNSTVFIPLYSPGYFLSEWCGREWAVFDRNVAQVSSMAPNGGFLPVVWLQPASIPPVALPRQHYSVSYGETYGSVGLRQLIKLRRYEDDYQETVAAFAAEIVRLTVGSPRRPWIGELPQLNIPSAFDGSADFPLSRLGGEAELRSESLSPLEDSAGPRSDSVVRSSVEPTGPALAPVDAGHRHVHFVIASAGRDEMQAVRSSLACYGPTTQHWAPYRPTLPEPIGPYACEIAAHQRLRAELAGLDDLADRIDRANERNQIVVLLVDPWIADLGGYGETLLNYDRRNEPTVPVMVALSDDDDETRQHRERLLEAVGRSLPNNSTRNDPIFRSDVRTPSQFATELSQSLEIALNRLMKRGTVYRRPPGPTAPPRAVLDSPDSLSNRSMP